jgi:hypothetical protein
MKNRPMIYMVFAIAIGYLLIGAVPGQVESLVSPKIGSQSNEEMFSDVAPETSEPPNMMEGAGERAEGEQIKSVEEEPSPNISHDSSELIVSGESESLLGLYKWWAVDFLIAFVIYYSARQLLS